MTDLEEKINLLCALNDAKKYYKENKSECEKLNMKKEEHVIWDKLIVIADKLIKKYK